MLVAPALFGKWNFLQLYFGCLNPDLPAKASQAKGMDRMPVYI